MKQITIYGIKNCDTMKKTFQWFDKHKIAYAFHDYKKDGADKTVLQSAIRTFGWESVLNRKGTTWRALSQSIKDSVTEKSAVTLACDNPSLIKRPLIVMGTDMLLGFDEKALAAKFGG